MVDERRDERDERVERPQQEVTRLRDDLARAERHRGEQELGRLGQPVAEPHRSSGDGIHCSALARAVAGPRRDLHTVRTKGNLAAMLPRGVDCFYTQRTLSYKVNRGLGARQQLPVLGSGST